MWRRCSKSLRGAAEVGGCEVEELAVAVEMGVG